MEIGETGDGGRSLTQIECECEWKWEWLMGDSGPRTESTLSFLRSNGVRSFMGAGKMGTSCAALGVVSIPLASTIEMVDLVPSVGNARSLNNRGCESDWGPL